MNELNINFLNDKLAYRAEHSGRRQHLARACGIEPGVTPSIIDATAGMGRDAYILATLGCDVIMLERNKVVAAALKEALNEANKDPDFSKLKLKLIEQDAQEYLQHIKDKPDVIYLDPMHPERKKSALVKKEMRIIREIVGDDSDASTLLALALKAASKRVVVKRQKASPPLNNQKPDLVYQGKSTRYDVYLCTPD